MSAHVIWFDRHDAGPRICDQVRQSGLAAAVIIPVRWDEFCSPAGRIDLAFFQAAIREWAPMRVVFRFALLTPEVVTYQGEQVATSNWAAVRKWGGKLRKAARDAMTLLNHRDYVWPLFHLGGSGIAGSKDEETRCRADGWLPELHTQELLRALPVPESGAAEPLAQFVPIFAHTVPLPANVITTSIAPHVASSDFGSIWRGLNDTPTWPAEAEILGDACAQAGVDDIRGDDWGPWLPSSQRIGRRANRDHTYLAKVLVPLKRRPRGVIVLQKSSLLGAVQGSATYDRRVARLLRDFTGK